MNEERPAPSRILLGLLVLFGLTYALGIPLLLLGWLGWQGLTPTWQHGSLPPYVCIFALGAVSVAGALRWRRWGVWGLAITWLATMVLNGLFPGPASPGMAIVAVLLLILFARQARRIWPRFH